MYDHTGVFAVKHNNATYFYRKDAQANVVALLDNNGSVVVKYKYDAWGNCKVLNADGSEITDSNHIGILNPFKYRSYYYDIGIGLYFLKTRYYDPEIGRFMTIDDISYLDPESINGLNLYAYCGNNPVMNIDPTGRSFLVSLLVFATVSLLTWGASMIFDEHLVSGVGLGVTGVSAVVSGIMAISMLTPVGWIVGGITAIAGVATLIFASAEIQQGLGYGNWLLDNGMSVGLYNTLMIASSTIASIGTVASSIAYKYQLNTVTQKGKIDGKMVSGKKVEGYNGIRFNSKTGKYYSIEIHPNHNDHGIHLQWNQWMTKYPKYPGEFVLKPLWRYRLW